MNHKFEVLALSLRTSSSPASTLPTSSATLGGMRSYPAEHWQALGEWVATARAQAGYSDTKKWAAEVRRSQRTMLGLERGESVGPKTIEAIAEVLGVANWSLFAILDRGSAAANPWTPSEVDDARARYENETGLEADDGDASSSLTYISDEDLVSELARRLATRELSRTERRMLEIEQGWGEPPTKPSREQREVDEYGRAHGQAAVRGQHEKREQREKARTMPEAPAEAPDETG